MPNRTGHSAKAWSESINEIRSSLPWCCGLLCNVGVNSKHRSRLPCGTLPLSEYADKMTVLKDARLKKPSRDGLGRIFIAG